MNKLDTAPKYHRGEKMMKGLRRGPNISGDSSLVSILPTAENFATLLIDKLSKQNQLCLFLLKLKVDYVQQA